MRTESPSAVLDAKERSSRRRHPSSTVIPLIVALIYSLGLSSLPLLGFKDRLNYLNYAGHSARILERHATDGLQRLLANEPIWLLVNIGLGRVFSPETVLALVIGIPAFLVATVVMRQGPPHSLVLLIWLVAPFVIKNHIVHLRQGMAIGVFLAAALLIRRRWIRVSLLIVTPFIHASFFFILLILASSKILMRAKDNLAYNLVLATVASVGVGLGFDMLVGGSGARQAEISGAVGDAGTGLGFVFWLIVLIIFVSAGASFIRTHGFAVMLLVFYLSTYFLVDVTPRILESGVMIVLLAVLRLDWRRRHLLIGGLLIFIAASYALRIGEPGLGWGLPVY